MATTAPPPPSLHYTTRTPLFSHRQPWMHILHAPALVRNIPPPSAPQRTTASSTIDAHNSSVSAPFQPWKPLTTTKLPHAPTTIELHCSKTQSCTVMSEPVAPQICNYTMNEPPQI
ncbi:hypothetical protein DEO72_LG5g1447 [Vigna unguiculata]|uniref:Uncharacterized protein n=1 Tax=Vigna unguiculata TaxID=3917 RepID=A0A4D6LWV7_VIGUN|nr:hypothetical protein DEO72_LG5g1447 [Vigna unguiculata]